MGRGINVDKPYCEDGQHNNFVDEDYEEEEEEEEENIASKPTFKLQQVENTSTKNQALEIEAPKENVALKKRLKT